jgi:hypothetical protein
MQFYRMFTLDISGKLLEILPTLLGVAVGALATLFVSWTLQNKQFKRQRLDKAREKVYGPLAWELKKMHSQVEELEYNPSREVADRIRDQEHLEWMIESRELRTKIEQLYDTQIPNFREAIYETIHTIGRKLRDDLSQQVESPDQDEGLTYDVAEHTRKLLDGLAWSVLRGRLIDSEEGGKERRLHYQKLLALVARLDCSGFDDYFSRAMTMCQAETRKVTKSQENLLSNINVIQEELERLLRPQRAFFASG